MMGGVRACLDGNGREICSHMDCDLQARGCVFVAVLSLAKDSHGRQMAATHRDGLDIWVLAQSPRPRPSTRPTACEQAQARPWSCDEHGRTALSAVVEQLSSRYQENSTGAQERRAPRLSCGRGRGRKQ
jgi:hypothetical protein